MPDVHIVKKPFAPQRAALRDIFQLAVQINPGVLLPVAGEAHRGWAGDLQGIGGR